MKERVITIVGTKADKQAERKRESESERESLVYSFQYLILCD